VIAPLVRDFQAADAAGVWHVHSESIKAESGPDADVSWAADLHDIEMHFVQTGGAFLVTEGAAGIVAIGGLRNLGAGLAELSRMRVLPAAQGAGVGRSLCEALIQRARRLGFSRLMLNTPIESLGAQRLYERCGFAKTEEIELHGMHMFTYELALAAA
jgi:GNAT superfamily N-acetyltransferase